MRSLIMSIVASFLFPFIGDLPRANAGGEEKAKKSANIAKDVVEVTGEDRNALFNLVAKKHKENLDRLRTWQGRAQFERTNGERRELAVIDFSVDRENLVRSAKYVSGDISIVVTRRDAAFNKYSLRPTDFNPFNWTTFFGKDIALRFGVFYEPGGAERDYPGLTLLKKGDLIILRLGLGDAVNQYTVDMHRGACLVAYDGHHGPEDRRSMDKWRCTLQSVSGVWIPKKTTSEEVSEKGEKSSMSIEWTNNVVNGSKAR